MEGAGNPMLASSENEADAPSPPTQDDEPPEHAPPTASVAETDCELIVSSGKVCVKP